MSDSGRTHFDAAESGAICHEACAVAEIRRLLAGRDALERELAEAHDIERSDGQVRRALDAKLAEMERELGDARRDAERVEWFFGADDKMAFLPTHLSGVGAKWSVAQWRAAIDAAMKGPSDE